MEENFELSQQCINQQSKSTDSPPMSFGSQSSSAEDGRKLIETTENYLQVDNLRSIYEIPQKYRHIFSPYPSFNIIQSKVLDDVYYSDAPVVVSAPTGSGKTAIFEMAIIRLLIKIEELQYHGDFKIVYMAPVKALCTERYNDWQVKFGPHGLRCQELTGDTWEADLSEVGVSRLLFTTPEKWDSLTRRWRDKEKMVQVVKLFLIDEVHLLNEEQRGPTLEVVVSRMKTVQKTLNFERKSSPQLSLHIRFIAVSATIPNIEDIAQWLSSETITARYHKVSEELRPVKLNKIVIGYPCSSSSSAFQFDISLSYKLRPLLIRYADSKPTLIFCSTRKSVEHTSATLAQQLTVGFSPDKQEYLRSAASLLLETKLRELVPVGVGFHHAGMDPYDRQEVERLFREGVLPILVTTSTLAMGVNLPAHLVVIKSTQQYMLGEYREYSETQVLQMIGRAGRPQFDTTATAIIMTREATKSKYEKLVEGKELVESSLHRHLPEHLNAEVVLQTICEIPVAMDWIRSTFLYIRVMRNPKHYGFPCHLERRGIERRLEEMCLKELHELSNAKLITLNVYDVSPTDMGQLMARYYIAFESMKMFSQIQGTETLPQMLELISKCREFYDIQLRANEKRTLNTLNNKKNKESIKFPLQGSIKTRDMKVNCLAQAAFGCLSVSEISLNQDMMKIMRVGERLMKCILQLKQVRQHFQSYLSALLLSKCFHHKMWDNSPYVARQLDRIGPNLSALLVAGGKTSFEALAESNPRDLERILNRPPPFGNRIQEMAKSMPRCSVDLQMIKLRLRDELTVKVELLNPQTVVQVGQGSRQHCHTFCLLVGDAKNSIILHKRIALHELVTSLKLSWKVVLHDKEASMVYAHLLNEKWIGLDSSAKIELHNTKQIQQTISQNLTRYLTLSQKQSSSLSVSTKPKSISITKTKKISLAEIIKSKQSTMTPMPDLTLKNRNLQIPEQINVSQFGYSPQRKNKLQPMKAQIHNQPSSHHNKKRNLEESSVKKVNNVPSSAVTNEPKEDTVDLQTKEFQDYVNTSVFKSQLESKEMLVTTHLEKKSLPLEITALTRIHQTGPKCSQIPEEGGTSTTQGENCYDTETHHNTEHHNNDKHDGFCTEMNTTSQTVRKVTHKGLKTMETDCTHQWETKKEATTAIEPENTWSDLENDETDNIMTDRTESKNISKDCRLDRVADSYSTTTPHGNANDVSHQNLGEKHPLVQQNVELSLHSTCENTKAQYLTNKMVKHDDSSIENTNHHTSSSKESKKPLNSPTMGLGLSKCKISANNHAMPFLNFDLGIDRLMDRNFLTDEDDSENENASKKYAEEVFKDTEKMEDQKYSSKHATKPKKIRHKNDVVAQALKDAPFLKSSTSSESSNSNTEEMHDKTLAASERPLLLPSSVYFTRHTHDKPPNMNINMSYGTPGMEPANTSPIHSSAESCLSQDLFTAQDVPRLDEEGTAAQCCSGSCTKQCCDTLSSCNSDASCCNSPTDPCSQVQFTSQFSPILKPHINHDDFDSSMDETSPACEDFRHWLVSKQNKGTVSQLTDYYPVTKRYKYSPK